MAQGAAFWAQGWAEALPQAALHTVIALLCNARALRLVGLGLGERLLPMLARNALGARGARPVGGKEPVVFPCEALKEALGRTPGVPIFQEQVMQVAILAAGFTPGEADQLRRSMAAWKRKGGLGKYYDKMVDGMTSRGYEESFSEATFEQIKGFSEYGFPESRCIVRAPGVRIVLDEVPPPGRVLGRDIEIAGVGLLLAIATGSRRAPLRRGSAATRRDVQRLRVHVGRSGRATRGQIGAAAHRRHEGVVYAARGGRSEGGPFGSAEDLARRAELEQHEMRLLAGANALMSLSGHHRQKVWDASAIKRPPEAAAGRAS